MASTIQAWISQTNGNIEFIVTDGRGFDAAVQQLLSSLGMKDNTTVVGIDEIRSNRYDMQTKLLKLEYEPDAKRAYILNDAGDPGIIWENIDDPRVLFKDPKFYAYRDKQICRSVDTALLAWDGHNRALQTIITTLKAADKPVYIFDSQ